MPGKKFYYHGNKKNDADGEFNQILSEIKGTAASKPPVKEDADRKPYSGAGQNDGAVRGRGFGRRGGNFDNRGRKENRPPEERQGANAAFADRGAKNARPVSELKLSDPTLALLEKNNLTDTAALSRKTERDMFKIQGFNKRMLFELREGMKASGAAFRQEGQKEPANREQKPGAADRSAGGRGQASDERPEGGQSVRDGRGGRQRKDGQAGGGFARRDEKPAGRRFEQDGRDGNFGASDRRTAALTKDPHERSPKEPYAVPDWRKIQKNGKWGFYDGFKTVVVPMYDEVFSFKDGLASVELEEKCGYINEKNEIIIPFEYDMAMSFSNGLACVAKGSKCGYINKENTVVFPFEYEAATPFEDGEAKVKKDGRWGTLSLSGTVKWIN